MKPIEIRSPDQQKSVLLEYRGEARFGPAFFVGRSSGFSWPLEDAIIGEEVHWSADSRFAVLLVFRARDTAAPPDVELVAIDTTTGSVLAIERNKHGLIYPQGFVSAREYEYIRVSHGTQTPRRHTFPST